MGQKLTKRDALLNPKTLEWKGVSDAGKADFNAEEGWTLLPDGSVLTEDVKNAPGSEIYTPSTGKWKSAGSTIVDLHSPHQGGGCGRYGPKPKDCYFPPGEIGPAVLRPDGTVFCTGSGSGASGYESGHTAIYQSGGGNHGTWSVGPDFPHYDNAGDSYAILEPSGSVLIFSVQGELYEFNGTSLAEITTVGYPDSPILLPTGQVLILGFTAPNAAIYTPKGSPKEAWAPTITSFEKSIVPGKTYKISGTQFNGLSQAMSFGDEFQNSTNYPLVRLQNVKTGRVYYARTHDHSTMAVATGPQGFGRILMCPRRSIEAKPCSPSSQTGPRRSRSRSLLRTDREALRTGREALRLFIDTEGGNDRPRLAWFSKFTREVIADPVLSAPTEEGLEPNGGMVERRLSGIASLP